MTGVKVNVRAVKKLFREKKKRVSASSFRPEVKAFASDVLSRCIATTPARALSKIRSAQTKQYRNRINYIPSVHSLSDPSLIVKPNGDAWIFTGGKWYRPDKWTVPNQVYAAYQSLLNERTRRMQTAQSEFIEAREQARFLYKRSWWQVAKSLMVSVAASAEIIASRTRRKPAVAPPKGYGQWHGGKSTLSVSIHNPFLDVAGKYWAGNGREILARATASAAPAFNRAVAAKVKERLSK